MPGPHASESCCANSGNPCSRQPPRPHQLPPVRNLPRPKNSPRGCFCPAVRWTRGLGFSIPARVTFYARHLLKSVYKEKSTTSNEVVLFGDPCGNRTHVNGVRGRCLNRLTNGPYKRSRHLPIFTGRFQPTIFGTSELNFCVRNGNRWNLTVIDTGQRVTFVMLLFLLRMYPQN